MARSLGLIGLLLLALAGCGKKHPADKVTHVADDDPRMNAAMEKARATVRTFIAALKRPRSGQTAFSIKMAFRDGKNVEHMWLTPVSYDGTNFHGTVNNEPDKVKNVKIGQKVSVARAQISDWMFIDNSKLVGGHTLRVLRETLPADERADFDRSLPFAIE